MPSGFSHEQLKMAKKLHQLLSKQTQVKSLKVMGCSPIFIHHTFPKSMTHITSLTISMKPQICDVHAYLSLVTIDKALLLRSYLKWVSTMPSLTKLKLYLWDGQYEPVKGHFKFPQLDTLWIGSSAKGLQILGPICAPRLSNFTHVWMDARNKQLGFIPWALDLLSQFSIRHPHLQHFTSGLPQSANVSSLVSTLAMVQIPHFDILKPFHVDDNLNICRTSLYRITGVQKRLWEKGDHKEATLLPRNSVTDSSQCISHHNNIKGMAWMGHVHHGRLVDDTGDDLLLTCWSHSDL
jgi:hypothetical protein